MGSGDAGFPRFPRQTKQIDKKIRHTPVLILGEASSLGIQLGVQNAMWQIPANNISQFSRKGHQAHWPCLGTKLVLDPTPMRIAGGSIRSVVWRIWHESALGTEYALPVLLVDTPRHTFLDWKRITIQMISKLKHQQIQFGEQWVKEALALFGGNTSFFFTTEVLLAHDCSKIEQVYPNNMGNNNFHLQILPFDWMNGSW